MSDCLLSRKKNTKKKNWEAPKREKSHVLLNQIRTNPFSGMFLKSNKAANWIIRANGWDGWLSLLGGHLNDFVVEWLDVFGQGSVGAVFWEVEHGVVDGSWDPLSIICLLYTSPSPRD
eukprot:TRINITY_DN6131_c0_g1_i2.p1 TRINITY_DN6131_c0_g1~~TRINITY_DN6131_c0_g1_i2.p1  ORF type:complete len:118 (-),score=9.73 TRINITY_DN6131_c0_g1_i2:30-383(-)